MIRDNFLNCLSEYAQYSGVSVSFGLLTALRLSKRLRLVKGFCKNHLTIATTSRKSSISVWRRLPLYSAAAG